MILKTMRNTANHHQHLNMATVMRTITVNHGGWGDHIFRHNTASLLDLVVGPVMS